jgi:hypothetical protein
MFLVFQQIGELKQIASSQNNIALNGEFFKSSNTGIISAIENNQPILTENGGKYTDAQLDNYLGDFDTIDQVYSEGLLTQDQLCSSFSYYVASTSENKEVQKYMIANPDFNSQFTDLVNIVASSTDPNCH